MEKEEKKSMSEEYIVPDPSFKARAMRLQMCSLDPEILKMSLDEFIEKHIKAEFVEVKLDTKEDEK
mgnify:CR=1 FL=1